MEREENNPTREDDREEPLERRAAVGEGAAAVVADAEGQQDDADDARNGEDRVAVIRRQDSDGDDLEDEDTRAGDKHRTAEKHSIYRAGRANCDAFTGTLAWISESSTID